MKSQVQHSGSRYHSLKEQFHRALLQAFSAADEQVMIELLV